jgi:hypothetical protein
MTPFQAGPRRERDDDFSREHKPSTSPVTGADSAQNPGRFKTQAHMAIESPKNKEELVRQFKFNPEIDLRLEAFMKAEPGLVQFVKELPRELLERKFLLRKMRDQQQKQGYDTRVKEWLEKPEQAELVTNLKATISPQMKPEQQSKALVNQAKNYIRNTGMKIT